MPQDSLRSAVYRSFVTCDDPKGVADCKTIRKSKKTEQKIKKASTSHDEEKEDLSFQVMEVSRGVERLNQVVDRPSEHIAADLLRGALHLHESLVMLGKLEKASGFIAGKHNGKRPIDLFGNDEKPRVSASRDCYDELRDVIRESFARQNLLPKESDRKHSELCVDLPSSSSSQTSSLLHFHSSGGSPSSSIRHEKTKAPSNLIAKLMGLEEVPPSRAADCAERVPYRRNPLLDIDPPRPKKPQFMVEKEVRERRTLEEIIETMQFKGILGRKDSDDCKYHSNALFLRKDMDADSPPIVIMRPLRGRGDRDQEPHCINEGEQMPRKMRAEFPQLKANEKSPSKQKLDGSREGKVRVRPVKKAALNRVSTTKMNQSKPLLPQMQKKEAPKIRKPADTKDGKTQDLAKIAALKHSKTVRENNVSKSQIARGKVAATDKGTKRTSLNRASPKKSPRRGESTSKPSSARVENSQSEGNFAINTETIIDESSVKNTEPEQIIEEVAKAYYMSDNSTDPASSPSDASGLMTKDDSDHIESDSCIPSFESDRFKGYKSTMNSRYLLLSSVSFLNHIEELFDTGTHDSTLFQTDCLPDSEVLDNSLLLDCAREILERKSLSCRSTRNPWSLNLLRRPKYHLSVEQLLEEISDTIEDLQNYSRSFGDVVLADSIYPMLDRDLWRNEEVTGAWDSGWRKGYTMEAVDEAMRDVEEQVLSEIVADLIIEIMQ